MNRINYIELQKINKVIEILTAYKEGKIIEFYTDENGWDKCAFTPYISIITANMYRIADKQENIETYEQ